MLNTIAPYCAQVKTAQKAAFKGRETAKDNKGIAEEFGKILCGKERPDKQMEKMQECLAEKGYGELAEAFGRQIKFVEIKVRPKQKSTAN
ncbi:MAG: hypothetical protein A2Y25_03520 [Candidatus Melainabacteria bacterium GWF2_37_15]|nr:MAG: hypothetical protein A2Y25_03520 [Candidatus Melainabacteria bacterium GWF2_37_15]